MTKYILNSGGLSNNLDKRRLFHQELVKDLSKQSPHILLCAFALPRNKWEAKTAEYQQTITSDLPEISPTFDVAFPDKFEQQVMQADVIYMNGGDDHLLMYWLKQFDLLRLFANKIIATNSASSDALATHFWTCDWRMPMDGLGVLPIKFLPHFRSQYGADQNGQIDWDAALQELEEFGDTSLPVYALEEGDFIVLDKDEVKTKLH